MKTTVEISDSLLEEVKELAAREHTTIRALMEEGLRRIVAQRQRTETFQLRDATFMGQGLAPDFEAAGWQRFRDVVYEDRGG